MNQGYSYCPYCLKLAVSRTRGIPTYDTCESGHRWLASEGVYPKPQPDNIAEPKPCPFCGARPTISDGEGLCLPRVECKKCDTQLRAYTLHEAIAAWNRRIQ